MDIYNEYYKLTQLDRNADVFKDRLVEVKEYLSISEEEVLCILNDLVEKKQNLLVKMAENKKKGFAEPTYETDEEVFEVLQSNLVNKIIGSMLRYHRYDQSIEVCEHLKIAADEQKLRVMDYGCGVGDHGLLFASINHKVTFVDIENASILFAKYRLEKREIDYDILEIKLENLYPKLGKQDLIMAGEVLEHLRNPVRKIWDFYDALDKGGYLWVSNYPFVKYDAVGDHLQEAYDLRDECLRLLISKFDVINDRAIKSGYLMKKKA